MVDALQHPDSSELLGVFNKPSACIFPVLEAETEDHLQIHAHEEVLRHFHVLQALLIDRAKLHIQNKVLQLTQQMQGPHPMIPYVPLLQVLAIPPDM